MELSIVQASELPKNARFNSGNGKKLKACWKMLDYNQRRTPAYSQHLPSYFVGHVESNGDTENPSAMLPNSQFCSGIDHVLHPT
uniref:Uncharacterized protein n=1 Tax=Salix viminalis TaxID=40686 RepID=A0A6N2LU37_SALVM